MYEERFNLSGSPFRLNPDPKFFFGSRSHNKAMAYLHYGLRQAEGFIVITGEIGAGKSMLIGHLLDQLDRTNVVAAHLLTSSLEPSALLSHILSAFRIEPANPGKSAELEAFEDFLFDQMNRGRRVLLIVDEAQNLPARTIEELRMLSNMDYDGTPLFQVFLVGQPEFRSILAKPDMEQFRQRVIATYHLDPLGADETKDYILHRLQIVGWADNPAISDDAFRAIHEATDGVPRKINSLANRIFLHSALEKLEAIDAAVVQAVVADLQKEAFAQEGEDVEAAPKPAKKSKRPKRVEREEDEEAQAAAPKRAAGGGGRVVVPFGAVRKIATPAEPPAAIAPQAPAIAPDAESVDPASQMSVLDRLRARRTAEPSETKAPPPATLKDVAQAIAAAAAAPAKDFEQDEDEADALDAEIPAGDWREAVMRSISDAREELKSAHTLAAGLKRDAGGAAERRAERLASIDESLARAEHILSKFRDAER